MSTLVKNISLFFTFQKTPLVDRCCFSHSEPFNAFILLRGGLDWKIITQWVKFSPWLYLCKPGVKSWKQTEFFSICISLHKSKNFGQKQNLSWHFAWNLVYPGSYRTPLFIVGFGITFFLWDDREFCSQSETRSFLGMNQRTIKWFVLGFSLIHMQP